MRTCPYCQTEVYGRSDKIYCNRHCKSAHAYILRKTNEKLFLDIDRALKTNRRLLKKHNNEGKTILRRSAIVSQGFNPHYFTHYWKNKQGNVYFFCYEFGFRPITQQGLDKYLLVQWQDYMATKNYILS